MPSDIGSVFQGGQFTACSSGCGGPSPAELDISVQENTLLMSGNAKDDDNGGYLHRGIARRGFERRFSLTDHMKVTGASLDNGLLCVDVVRDVPEAAKPRTIKIGTAVETVRPQVTEHKGGPIGTSNGNRPKSQKRPRNLGAFCHWRRTLGPTYR